MIKSLNFSYFKKIFVFLTAISFGFKETSAVIKNSTVYLGATGIGLAFGGAFGGGYYIVHKDFVKNNAEDLKNLQIGCAIGGGVIAAIVGFCAGLALSEHTAKGKYNKSKSIVGAAKGFTLFDKSIVGVEDVKRIVAKMYPSSGWPLIEADNAVNYLNGQLWSAKELLTDVIENSSDAEYVKLSEKLMMEVKYYLVTADDRKTQVRADEKEYDRQYKRYQKYLEEVRKEQERLAKERQHKEEMALKEQRINQQYALQQQNFMMQNQILNKISNPQPTVVYVPQAQPAVQQIAPTIPAYVAPANYAPVQPVDPSYAPSAPAFQPDDFFPNFEQPRPSAPRLEKPKIELPKAEAKDTTCSICLEDDTNVNVPCCHKMFHRACLDQWTSKNPTCPNCRSALLIY